MGIKGARGYIIFRTGLAMINAQVVLIIITPIIIITLSSSLLLLLLLLWLPSEMTPLLFWVGVCIRYICLVGSNFLMQSLGQGEKYIHCWIQPKLATAKEIHKIVNEFFFQ